MLEGNEGLVGPGRGLRMTSGADDIREGGRAFQCAVRQLCARDAQWTKRKILHRISQKLNQNVLSNLKRQGINPIISYWKYYVFCFLFASSTHEENQSNFNK